MFSSSFLSDLMTPADATLSGVSIEEEGAETEDTAVPDRAHDYAHKKLDSENTDSCNKACASEVSHPSTPLFCSDLGVPSSKLTGEQLLYPEIASV